MINILNELEAGAGGNYSTSEILEAIGAMTPCDRARFRMVAFAGIVLRDKLANLAEVKRRLLSTGVSLATWKNAQHLICIYEDIVKPGHADMKWFESIGFERALMIKRIISERGIGWLRRSGLLRGTTGNWAEIFYLHSTGRTYAESKQSSTVEKGGSSC